MRLLFPDVDIQDFDFKELWLVRAVNDESKDVLFEGRGKNIDLEVVLNYATNEDGFKLLSVGELIVLSPHQFIVDDTEDYQPKTELF
ncbi:Uncharacterised protein [Streptococcus pseudoporcinus]|uniref:Uncharacterized protein n=1 Tax=Streptococcus pseudoporcinus TaxID=361101 RepID=A0A4U9Z216_9STRE|nr:hypothetical protein [Streptococcus pseudoporcinus]VTS33014.1 Uncharacterised protein [Streptococcus pseudoporcinus]